ncbi:MAG TPA: Hsp33 family molecular chaperone HslO [Acidaminococcaceae bacterium]|nr:Hsp33 family molecular chaperone HslO [Acidaminococcaceae bacterium]
MTEDKIKLTKENFRSGKDILTRATVGDVRIYVARTTRLVRRLSVNHHTSHLATAALGRAVTGALLLAATMKNNEGVGIKIAGDGPIGQVIAEAQGGTARGYVGNPDVFLPPKNGHFDVGGAVGTGTISVTRYTEGMKPFTGTASLVDGEIADDLTNYLWTSEQTPSSVALGVLVTPEGDVQAAGGWFIQCLPDCGEEVLDKLDRNVRQTPYVSSLIDMGFEPGRIIRMLGKGLPVDILDSYPLQFACNCSREKIEGVLRTLPEKELEAMAEDEVTEATCPYCNARYTFSREEIRSLADKAEK